MTAQPITIPHQNASTQNGKTSTKKTEKRCNDAPQNGLSGENPKIRVNPNETGKQRHKRLRTMQRALAAYGRFGTVSAACHRARVNRSTWSRWRSNYPWFDQAVADKHADIGDELEGTAIQRALAGDSRLMIALLKRFKPEEYSDRYERHNRQHDPVETLEEAHERARAKVIALRGRRSS